MNGSRPSSSQGPLRAVQDGRIVEEAWGEGAIRTRKEKRNIWGVSSFLQGKGMEGFSSFRCCCFPWAMERVPVTDDLMGVHQKIPDELMELVFLGEAEMAVRSGVDSTAHVTPSGSVVFSLAAHTLENHQVQGGVTEIYIEVSTKCTETNVFLE